MVITVAQLKDLIRKWERPKVDFKSQLPLFTKEQKREFVKDVCAIANSQGGVGYLIIGVNNKKQVVGIPKGHVREEQLQQILTHNCDPPIAISVQILKYNGKNIGVIEITPSLKKPHQVTSPGAFYIRHGSTTKVMSIEEVMHAMLRRREIEKGRQGEYDHYSIADRATKIREDVDECFHDYGFNRRIMSIRSQYTTSKIRVYENPKSKMRFYCRFFGDSPSEDDALRWYRDIHAWWEKLDSEDKWFNSFCLFTSSNVRTSMLRDRYMPSTMNITKIETHTVYKGVGAIEGEIDQNTISSYYYPLHIPEFLISKIKSKEDIRTRIGIILDFVKNNPRIYRLVKQLKKLEKRYDRQQQRRFRT